MTPFHISSPPRSLLAVMSRPESASTRSPQHAARAEDPCGHVRSSPSCNDSAGPLQHTGSWQDDNCQPNSSACSVQLLDGCNGSRAAEFHDIFDDPSTLEAALEMDMAMTTSSRQDSVESGRSMSSDTVTQTTIAGSLETDSNGSCHHRAPSILQLGTLVGATPVLSAGPFARTRKTWNAMRGTRSTECTSVRLLDVRRAITDETSISATSQPTARTTSTFATCVL